MLHLAASIPARRRPLGPLASARFWIYLVVSATWLAVMALLWARESGRIGRNLVRLGISPEVLLVSWTDYEHWLWIEQAGRRIGLTTMNIVQLTARPAERAASPEPPGYRMQTRTQMALHLMGLAMPVQLASQVRMNAAFELETLQAGVRLADHALLIQAFAENRSLYYRVRLEADSASSATQSVLSGLSLNPVAGLLAQVPQREICGRTPLEEPILLTDAVLPMLTRSHTLRAGDGWVSRVSNPLAGMLHSEMRITVERKEQLGQTQAWRVVEQLGGMRSTHWYDLHGRLVQGEMGDGLRLVQATASGAVAAYPEFKRAWRFPEKIDRAAIKRRLDPRLDGTPLSQLIPPVPGL